LLEKKLFLAGSLHGLIREQVYLPHCENWLVPAQMILMEMGWMRFVLSMDVLSLLMAFVQK